jgi:hypothetical protein
MSWSVDRPGIVSLEYYEIVKWSYVKARNQRPNEERGIEHLARDVIMHQNAKSCPILC